MPIRPELRHFYSGPAWRATRKRILERAKNRCERCQKPNGAKVLQFVQKGRMWWKGWDAKLWRNQHGRLSHTPMPAKGRVYLVRIVLTIAHLNQVAGDDREENLAALCQWCHLRHDRGQHLKAARETRTNRKDAGRPLLQESKTA